MSYVAAASRTDTVFTLVAVAAAGTLLAAFWMHVSHVPVLLVLLIMSFVSVLAAPRLADDLVWHGRELTCVVLPGAFGFALMLWFFVL